MGRLKIIKMVSLPPHNQKIRTMQTKFQLCVCVHTPTYMQSDKPILKFMRKRPAGFGERCSVTPPTRRPDALWITVTTTVWGQRGGGEVNRRHRTDPTQVWVPAGTSAATQPDSWGEGQCSRQWACREYRFPKRKMRWKHLISHSRQSSILGEIKTQKGKAKFQTFRRK